jgi:hypothetical protein
VKLHQFKRAGFRTADKKKSGSAAATTVEIAGFRIRYFADNLDGTGDP